ncbi:uncharacterized protein LOC126811930 [Patella vulgata]|uniref:uncharacterized protein LOC126811930 n=1 Tax=Patella vulgata TaxID=6465 RepID=UPI0024A96A29|nr:uncharacterized protein LOC126811930 [Patella vulgata]
MEEGTPTSSGSSRQIKWHTNLSDFANMVKAFIGSNYLSISFAFSQSGLVAGMIGLFLIASVTDHCCHLIVKCKNLAIKKVLREHRKQLLGDIAEEEEEDDHRDDYFSEMKAKMKRSLTYGDVGQIALGNIGLYIVNACILLTQFGFCVGYFILIGNTIYSMFPLATCDILRNSTNQSFINMSNCKINSIIQSDLPKDLQKFHLITEDMPIHARHPQLALLDNLKREVSRFPDLNLTNLSHPETSGNSSFFDDDGLENSLMLGENNSSWTVLSNHVYTSTAPLLQYLVLIPLPIFIGFSFMRNIRHLGPVSVAANISILIGCVSVTVFLLDGFTLSKTYKLFVNMEGLPVFFGMVTGAFEGIGTVIPIESSMVGNRHLFSGFLHGAILFLSVVLSFFGIFGYLRFGVDVAQMINGNLPLGSAFSLTVNLCLCIGVVLTFPLMLYPVIELMEIYTFTDGRICGPKKKCVIEEEGLVTSDDSQPLIGDKTSVLPVAAVVSLRIPAWKRNILRTLLVLMAAGLAVLFRNNFAYILAFVGAIGSSLLAYILPCIFHIKLSWSNMSVFIKFKDILLIIVGSCCSIVSCYSVVVRIVNNT